MIYSENTHLASSTHLVSNCLDRNTIDINCNVSSTPCELLTPCENTGTCLNATNVHLNLLVNDVNSFVDLVNQQHVGIMVLVIIDQVFLNLYRNHLVMFRLFSYFVQLLFLLLWMY